MCGLMNFFDLGCEGVTYITCIACFLLDVGYIYVQLAAT